MLVAGGSRLSTGRALLLLGACIVVGLALARFWRRLPVGELVWDGGAWWWHATGREHALALLEVRLDLQRALLLRGVDATGAGVHWWWAEAAGHDAPRWHLLRCALYSSSPPRPGPASSSEAATG